MHCFQAKISNPYVFCHCTSSLHRKTRARVADYTCSTCVTNQDVLTQLSTYLQKEMGPKERTKQLGSNSMRACLQHRKVKAAEIKTRMDLLLLLDGSFGCSWCVCLTFSYF